MTNPAKPTPGPWRVQNGPNGITVRRVSDGKPVAEIWFNGDDLDTLLATARLFAAAPDLAAELRKVLPFAEAEAKVRIDSFTPPPGGFPPITPDEQDVIDEAQAAVDTIRAALAKLEG